MLIAMIKKFAYFKIRNKLEIFSLIMLFFLVNLPLLCQASIEASVERNPVNLEDSFDIIFTSTETPEDLPDFSPLKQNFSVLSQSQSENSSWINGQSSRTIKWVVSVMANRPGKLEIPAIRFGSTESNAISVTVMPVAASKNLSHNDDDLFMEVSAIPENPYVQEQIIYTLKLYTRVDIAQAKLNEPELADAVIEKLTEDSSYNTRINGVEYSVTERKYALFPQKSGTLTINPLVLTAEVVRSSNSTFNGFFNPQLTRSKRIESKAIIVKVKPIPNEFDKQHWLPAEKVELSQQFSGDVQQMKIGDPLTRTLTIKAKGVSVGQLPELSTMTSDNNLKTYPDQPILNEKKLLDGLTASREEKIAIIPSKEGNYKLPAIEIPWFNTETKKIEIATLPETSVNVLSSEHLPEPNTSEESTTTSEQKSSSPNVTKPVEITTTPVATSSTPSIWIWVSVFLGVGWLVTIIFFLQKNKPIVVKEETTSDAIISLKNLSNQLKTACSENDMLMTKNILQIWGQQEFEAGTLGVIATHCDARLRDEILILSEMLYGKKTTPWQGKKLFQAFSEQLARKKTTHKDSNDASLKSLHPL